MKIFKKKSWVLIIGLLITALTVVLFVIYPSFLSSLSEFFINILDSDILNLVLVSIAILLGVLLNRNTTVESGSWTVGGGRDHSLTNLHSQHHHHHHHYYHLGRRHHHPRHRRPVDPKRPGMAHKNQNMDELSSLSSSAADAATSTAAMAEASGKGLLRRNSNSFPDLRQEPFWKPDPERRRYYDDNDVNTYQYGEPSYPHHPQPSAPPVPESYDTQYTSNPKTIPPIARQQEISSSEPSRVPQQPTKSPTPKTPSPPPPAAERRRKEREEKRTIRLRKRTEKSADEETNDLKFKKHQFQSLIPPPLQPTESEQLFPKTPSTSPPSIQPTESPELLPKIPPIPPPLQPTELPQPLPKIPAIPPPTQPTESPQPLPNIPPTAPMTDRRQEQEDKQAIQLIGKEHPDQKSVGADKDMELEKGNFGDFLFRHFFGEPLSSVGQSPTPPPPPTSPTSPYENFINFLNKY